MTICAIGVFAPCGLAPQALAQQQSAHAGELAGSAIPSAFSNTGLSGNIAPQSYIAVTDVSLNKSELTMKVGESEKLIATVEPESAFIKTLKWTSSNEKIAKVSSDGTVSAIAKGKATITVRTTDGYKTATCKLLIVKKKTKLIAKNKTFKAKKKTKKYQCKLKTSTGNALKKAKVTLKVNGKTYKAKTKAKGIATFNLKKLKKKGKYTATIKYAGSKKFKPTSKKVKIVIKK